MVEQAGQMDEALAKRLAAMQAEVDRQRPPYRAAFKSAINTVSQSMSAVGATPMVNALILSLAEIAAEAIASIPDPALRMQSTNAFIAHMGGAIDHYLPQFESGQMQSVAIHDTSAPAN